MKVSAVSTKMSKEQRDAHGVDDRYNPSWQITVGREYLVYSIACIPSSTFYGKVVLYRIVDDFSRLVPAPACLFEITDRRVSRHWVVGYDNLSLSLLPKEFVDNPHLLEDVHDLDDKALSVFAMVKDALEAEF